LFTPAVDVLSRSSPRRTPGKSPYGRAVSPLRPRRPLTSRLAAFQSSPKPLVTERSPLRSSKITLPLKSPLRETVVLDKENEGNSKQRKTVSFEEEPQDLEQVVFTLQQLVKTMQVDHRRQINDLQRQLDQQQELIDELRQQARSKSRF
jgi:hypothetical protein